jgi:catechol 2,3-dioxygenase-like lactoylglutathione lyase family enzyme
MEQRLSLLSIGVKSIAAARAFYVDGLGWNPAGPSGDTILFFQLPGFVLSITTHQHLAGDMTVNPSPAMFRQGAYRGFALACNVHSRDEVMQTIVAAEDAGGVVLKHPTETDWGGYSGYFADPDGNAWEVAHAPGWIITPEGHTIMP